MLAGVTGGTFVLTQRMVTSFFEGGVLPYPVLHLVIRSEGKNPSQRVWEFGFVQGRASPAS